jgi:hypothetical protein
MVNRVMIVTKNDLVRYADIHYPKITDLKTACVANVMIYLDDFLFTILLNRFAESKWVFGVLADLPTYLERLSEGDCERV